MTMNPGTVYIANTASKTSTAATQASSRVKRDVRRGVGTCMEPLRGVAMLGVFQAGCGAARWMGASLTGRFTSPAKIPSPIAMYHTTS